MFKRGLQHNVQYYTWFYTLSGLIFPIPVWVAFFTKIITLEQLALITALESIITLTLEVPTGALADILGRRTSIIMGSVLLAGFFFALPFAGNFMQIFLLHFVSGAGSALISGSDSAILYDSLKETGQESNAGKIYTQLGFYYRAGIIGASLVAGYMFSIWRGFPYFARGTVVLGAAFFIWLMVEPTIDSVKFSWGAYLRQTAAGLQELTKSLYLKEITLYYIAVASITYACLTYFNQPFAYDFDFTPVQMSYITAGIYIAATAILYFVMRHENSLSRKSVYIGFPILMAAALLPGIFVGRSVALLVLIGAQLAGSARFSILDKYMNKEFSSKNRATALSTLNMGVSLVMAAIIFAGGRVQAVSDTRHVFTYMGILTVILISPLTFLLVREHRRYETVKMSMAVNPELEQTTI